MSVTAVSAVCKNLIIGLGSQNNLPESFLDENGTFMALKSPANVAGYQQTLSDIENEISGKGIPNSGAFPKVYVKYKKPDCTEAGDSVPNPCTAGSVGADQYGYLDFVMQGYKATQFTITNDQFNAVCYNKDPYLENETRFAYLKLMRAVNKDLQTKTQALMGAYSNGVSSLTTPKTVNLLKGDGSINVAALPIIKAEFNKIYSTGGVQMVGGQYLNLYREMLKLSTPNSNNGLDATKLPSMPYYFDSSIDANIGSGDCIMLAWANGAIQLAEAYKYVGAKSWDYETSKRYTMAINGFKFDFAMEFKPCDNGGTWVVTLSKNYDLFYIPTAAYTCLPTGANHKLQFILGCGDVDCTMLAPCN